MKGLRTVTLNNGADVPKPFARLAVFQIQELARLHSDTLDAVVRYAHSSDTNCSEEHFTAEQSEVLVKQSILESDGKFKPYWRDLLKCSVEYDLVLAGDSGSKSSSNSRGKEGNRRLVNPLRLDLKQLNRPHRIKTDSEYSERKIDDDSSKDNEN